MSCNYVAGIDTVRLTRLDSCGRPVCGADNAFVTQCVATLSMTANTDDGTEISYVNGRGEQCAYLQRCPVFKNLSVQLDVLFASPEMLEIATNSPTTMDFAGAVDGFETGSIQCAGLAIEGWVNLLNAQCSTTGQGEWLYVLIPFITGGVLGDLEIGAEAVNFSVSGNTRSGGSWGTGPYNVVAQNAGGTPGPLLAPLASTSHRLIKKTTIAPPTPSCGYLPVTCTSAS